MKLVLDYLKEKWYLIIPIICIFFWALLSIIKDNFYIYNAADFDWFYYASKNIFSDPVHVFSPSSPEDYNYAPSIVTIFGVIVAIFSFKASAWILFICLFIAAVFSIVEFNKILILYKVDNKIHRFLYLIVLSNGLRFIQLFDVLQTKIIVAFLLLLFLRREIQIRHSADKPNDFKFRFTQMMILIFAIGLVPHYALFLIIIYLFHGITLKEIFKKEQIKKYLLMIVVFLIQNFMYIVVFILSPKELLYIFGYMSQGSRTFPQNITYSDLELINFKLPPDALSTFFHIVNLYIDLTFLHFNILLVISILSLLITSIVLSAKKNLNIEQKFGYIALFSLFLNVYYHVRDLNLLLPLVALLFIINLKNEKKVLNFIRNNVIWIFGLALISILYFVPPLYFLVKYFPFISSVPFIILFLIMPIIYIFIVLALLLLRNKKKQVNITELNNLADSSNYFV